MSAKDLIKRILRKPANAITSSSTSLTYRLDQAFNSTSLTARFFPVDGFEQSFVHLKPPPNTKPGLPVPPQDLWEYYGKNEQEYLQTGATDVTQMLAQLGQTGFKMTPGMRVLDFGCAGGRMVRHFEPYAKECEIWGIDLSAKNILWCQDHLSPPFKFATTTTFPHLPFEDNSFDLVYCASVFTHITGLYDMWLLELRRILRPGGRVWATIHDRHVIDIVLAGKYPDQVHLPFMIRRCDAECGFLKSEFALATWTGDAKKAQVFYDLDWIKRHWTAYMDIISVVPEAYGYQTALILQKRDGRAPA